jgi:hypothetical protein
VSTASLTVREVRIGPGLRCRCGRGVAPSDLTAISDDAVRAVCSGCHRDWIEILLRFETSPCHYRDIAIHPGSGS